MLRLKVPALLLLNKTDLIKDKKEVARLVNLYKEKFPKWEIITLSAQKKTNVDKVIPAVLKHLPEAPPFYPEDSISDRPVRFFVSELIREQIYNLYHEEIPYHSAVIIQSFEEKPTLNVIKAEIIVSRETQKIILLGKGGSMIKQLGINARKKIEEFLQAKVHLELFIKVRPKWRDNENHLREYGYN
jgi:GTP-binding protein Era